MGTWGWLVRQAVGVDEEAVVLLFETLHLGDGVAILGDPGGVAGFEGGRGSEEAVRRGRDWKSQERSYVPVFFTRTNYSFRII